MSEIGRKLIVGLGNPGSKYENTRHNIGFAVVAKLAQELAIDRTKRKFSGELAEGNVEGVPVTLLCPETYMNRSGKSVREAFDFYKLCIDDVLLVCDDLALELGRLRFRPKGSSGGQKGLGDTIRALGTDEFSRLRVGIGSAPAGWDAADYVLSKFTKDEMETVEHSIHVAADAVGEWVRHGTAQCMNKYNSKTSKNKNS